MSTRCMIAERLPDGSIRAIYCHHDGYPSGVGTTLSKHYTDPGKLSALLDLGDISSLASRLKPGKNEAHTFEKPALGVVSSYADRGDHLPATDFSTLSAYRQYFAESWCDFAYLFRNGVWHIAENDGSKPAFRRMKAEA